MKSAPLSDLKSSFKTMPQAQLAELCLRLARFKKDNKELLTYLLYEADDLPAYINSVKKELDEQLADMNTGNVHWIKKSLRKMLRLLNKHIRYTGSKMAEAELRLYFCTIIKNGHIPIVKSAALANLYNNQLKKIETVIQTMHEDLQRDYSVQLDVLKGLR